MEKKRPGRLGSLPEDFAEEGVVEDVEKAAGAAEDAGAKEGGTANETSGSFHTASGFRDHDVAGFSNPRPVLL